MKFIDITTGIEEKIPIWPGNPNPYIKKTADIKKGDNNNVTSVSFDVHTGTHIDAPAHFLKNGAMINDLEIKKLIIPCFVYDTKNEKVINTKIINSINLPKNIKGVLFKTTNSNLWKNKKFNKNYVALTPSASKILVEKNIELVGIDYLSIQRFKEKDNQTHKILLKNNIIIVEGLNLKKVKQGTYELIVLPIKIKNSEGAPARAILKTINNK